VHTSLTLDTAPLGTPLVVLTTDAEPAVARRLAALGVRRGARVTLVQGLAAGGRIVSVGGGRVAVERRVLAGVRAEVVA